jgi:hypothetical protein
MSASHVLGAESVDVPEVLDNANPTTGNPWTMLQSVIDESGFGSLKEQAPGVIFFMS